jgi:polyisoprenoid-binding protein YceI
MKGLLCALALLLTAGAAHAANWQMDKTGSRLEFVSTYQGQPAPGVFRDFTTRLQFDPAQPARGKLEVDVAVTSVDMGSDDLHEGMRAPEWFDFARFPKAQFRSQQIKLIAPQRYEARGTLTLKGVQQEVTVPFAWDAKGQTAVMTGELTLNRTRFGIGTGEWATPDPIGLDVKVKFKVTLRRGG